MCLGNCVQSYVPSLVLISDQAVPVFHNRIEANDAVGHGSRPKTRVCICMSKKLSEIIDPEGFGDPGGFVDSEDLSAPPPHPGSTRAKNNRTEGANNVRPRMLIRCVEVFIDFVRTGSSWRLLLCIAKYAVDVPAEKSLARV